MTSCILCTRFGCSSEPWFRQHFCVSEKVKLFSSCKVNNTVGAGGRNFHEPMITVNVVITVGAQFLLLFSGFWSLSLPSGVHIECSMCAQPASKEVKWQTINWIYCACIATEVRIAICQDVLKNISNVQWQNQYLLYPGSRLYPLQQRRRLWQLDNGETLKMVVMFDDKKIPSGI